MLIVAALGGNAMLRRGEAPELSAQHANLAVATTVLAELARVHRLVVTHGNGPQIGLLALQAASCSTVSTPSLDVLGAETEGMIGYLIEQQLAPKLAGRPIATLLTQVEVDPDDPAFNRPDKPIGQVYDATTAARLAAERGWSVARDGAGFRRVVPSPAPRRILELGTIRLLVEAGVTVICAGGGGIPVALDATSAIRGLEAVIDKDLTTALLAIELHADALLLLTDITAVLTDWPAPGGEPIRHATPAAMRARRFAAGSMAPKVEAACRFAEETDRPAFIGALSEATAVLAGRAGTRIARI